MQDAPGRVPDSALVLGKCTVLPPRMFPPAPPPAMSPPSGEPPQGSRSRRSLGDIIDETIRAATSSGQPLGKDPVKPSSVAPGPAKVKVRIEGRPLSRLLPTGLEVHRNERTMDDAEAVRAFLNLVGPQ